jgi:hypothetical protein
MLPVLKHIGSIGTLVHLHPAVPLNRIGLDAPSLFLSRGFPSDTSLNIVRLIRSGIFDEPPDLKPMQVASCPTCSGGLPVTALHPQWPPAMRLAHPIEHYFGNLFVDTVCYHTPISAVLTSSVYSIRARIPARV